MNALAVLFRLLSLFSVAGLAAFLWFLSETRKSQTNVFLENQLENGYLILQSEKEAQWKDISSKKSSFNEVFDDNQPVGLNDENPLSEALASLRSSEDVILRNADYRDSLEDLTKEFGAGSLFGIQKQRSGKKMQLLKSNQLLV